MPEPPSPERPVLIVGGGWAGLAAAVHLCAHKMPVVVIESARQLGGRARSIRFDEEVVDNGQHLMVGAYQSMLSLMQQVGVDLQQALYRQALTLRLMLGRRNSLYLRTPGLPPPLHLLYGLLTARGLSFRDRIQAMKFGRRLPALKIPAGEDISVQALLHSERQTPALMRKVWEPLCIATLNTPMGEASARIFIRVLQEAFLHFSKHSDMLIPKKELSDLLPRPCMDYLEQRGARIVLGQRVTGIEIQGQAVEAVQIRDQKMPASQVILATPHVISRRLMAAHDSLQSVRDQLAQLGNEPITTLYLQYPQRVRLPQPMVGLDGATAQWIFDRRVCGQLGLMAVVISAGGPHMQWGSEQLTQKIAEELHACYPHWPAHEKSLLVREKRATFSSRVGVDRIRPNNKTAVRGLWLAGDYTDHGLPATLEGAVRSGIGCAQAILNELG